MRRLLIVLGMVSLPATLAAQAIDTRALDCGGGRPVERMGLEIAGGEGRVRVPPSLVPRINAGQEGWFALKNVKTNHKDITAAIELNPATLASLRLDRMTGAVSLTGTSGSFSGTCRPVHRH